MIDSYFLAGAAVCMLAIGQLLFKLSAMQIIGKPIWALIYTPTFILAVLVYAVATVAWVVVLKRFSLSHIYPVIALNFVLVPAMSFIVLKEPLHLPYFAGTALILCGVTLIVFKG